MFTFAYIELTQLNLVLISYAGILRGNGHLMMSVFHHSTFSVVFPDGTHADS